MNKTIAFSLVIISNFSAGVYAANSAYDGLNVATGIGYATGELSLNIATNPNPGIVSTNHYSRAYSSINYAFMLGYAKTFSKFYTAVELQALLSGGETSAQYDELNIVREKSSATYNLLFKPGLLLGKSSIVYANIGISTSSIDSQVTGEADCVGSIAFPQSFNKHLLGGNFGVGFETLFSDHFGLRLDYSHIVFGDFDKQSELVQRNYQYKLKNNIFLMSLAYHFGSPKPKKVVEPLPAWCKPGMLCYYQSRAAKVMK